MATNFYPTPDPSEPAEYHAAWCDCGRCNSSIFAYDRARRRAPLLTGLLIAVIVAGIVALAISGVQA